MRGFLKNEAMKMSNGDYNVLYALVKDKKLSSGKSFEEARAPHFGGLDKLRAIERQAPLLTMFVPTLPENSFSAEKWDADSEIPFVAIRLSSTNDVPIISPEGEEYMLDSELIPSYPVVVIKDNERMMYKGQLGYDQLKSTRVLTNSEGVNYKFVSDIFDSHIQSQRSQENFRLITNIDQKLVDAYNIYQGADGWQRDYIYYGLTPGNPNGQLSYDFVEHIRSFNIVGNARSVFNAMSANNTDVSDPQIHSGKRSSGWTEGNFEIKANVLIQAKNGIGQNIPSDYLVNGTGLFNVTYIIDRRGVWPFRYDYFIINTVTAKPQAVNFPIVPWDLNNYAAVFRIDIEESDSPTKVTTSTTETVKFATNFAIEGTLLKKIGLKFGASLENTVSNTVTRETTLGSYEMGPVIVNFADKVVVSGFPYNSREYSNNVYSISVEPKRVQ